MKKTKKKVGGSSKSRLSPEGVWLGNPLFVAALITIMAVLAFILADDWLNLRKSAVAPVVPAVRVEQTPTKVPLKY